MLMRTNQRGLYRLLAAMAIVFTFGAARAQLGTEISPANAHVSSAPGTTLNGSVSVRNPTGRTITLAVSPSDFVLQPDNGIVALPVGSLPTSLAPWLQVGASSLTLKSGQSTTLRYSIKVPTTAGPGTHWGMIVFRATQQPNGDQSSMSMGASVQLGFVIYVDIGSLKFDGSVSDIALAKDPKDASAQDVTVTFKNTGNAYMRLHGTLEIRSTQGKLLASYDLPEKASLPESTTAIPVPLKQQLDPGAYLATAIVNYGTPARIAGQAEIHVP